MANSVHKNKAHKSSLYKAILREAYIICVGVNNGLRTLRYNVFAFSTLLGQEFGLCGCPFLNAPQGTLLSPGYPQSLTNLDCSWRIEVNPNKVWMCTLHWYITGLGIICGHALQIQIFVNQLIRQSKRSTRNYNMI